MRILSNHHNASLDPDGQASRLALSSIGSLQARAQNQAENGKSARNKAGAGSGLGTFKLCQHARRGSAALDAWSTVSKKRANFPCLIGSYTLSFEIVE